MTEKASLKNIAQVESHGIISNSMGGFGLFKTAMPHPDVFGTAYSRIRLCANSQKAEECLKTFDRLHNPS
jgi:S-formylglutathione hydrolase FrmB